MSVQAAAAVAADGTRAANSVCVLGQRRELILFADKADKMVFVRRPTVDR